VLRTSTEAPEAEATPLIAEIRRRIQVRYYDRPEVRRTLSRIILRQLALENALDRPERPESA